MAFGSKGSYKAPMGPMSVPAPGKTSSVGPKPPALPKPRMPNTRDYGKPAPAPLPQPSPFGSTMS